MSQEYTNYRVSAKESLSSIERKLSDLIKDKPYKIRLPAKLNNDGALGVEASVLQLLGTWIRKNRHKKIFHTYQKGEAQEFSKLCTSMYGICALSLTDEVWDVSGERLKRGMVLNYAKDSVDALKRGDFANSFKSKYMGIPFIKTPSYDRELEMPLYNNSDVIESSAFYRIFENILREKIAGYSRFETLKKSIDLHDLSDLLWEVFKNTHDHGRSHVNGDSIATNFRTVIIRQPDIDKSYFDGWLGDNPTPAQKKFVEYWKDKNFEKYPFIDLSVVDFGEGFVEMARGKAGSLDGKMVFFQCLESGWSRLSGKSRGEGLSKVLSAVRKHNGWLRIRSGKFLIEKTFEAEMGESLSFGDIQEMDEEVSGVSFHVSFFLKGYGDGGLS
ncbi:hypothetical protein KO507_17045 [Gilvimarinus agarilyticus]|uniref:hypothetical protein n=1 Tax=Gilvimarinus sp. 2_MG-2023 TaxID=3062666 RepID=UPI001C09FEE7|nr:hypothetical protein [Gilvimarinus sp. 2_MG-2023]MBU2887474.1 hypothetical protein [Gilvimarinus agarilyticus]MDO6572126.1 hypothetical protein [Gilvimarinus sp. 2_MG-2023]